MATSIIQMSEHKGIYGGELVNGGAVRYLSLVVIYDERGPWITNYTASGCGEWGFETKRRISTKAVTTPDWTNPSGFIVKDGYDSFSDCYPHTLYLNRYNIPDERYHEGEWRKYTGCSIKREDTVGGCKFLRILSYPWYRRTEHDLSEAMDRYYELTGDGRNHLIALGNSTKVLDAINDIVISMDGCEINKKNFKEASIESLMDECGAHKPIHELDWCCITNKESHAFRPYLVGTYEV